VNALQRIHRSLIPNGVVFDLQPALANAPVVNSRGVLGRLDEHEFRAFADRVNSLLQETISAGLFTQEREVIFTVMHRFNEAAQFLTEVKTWTGTTVPAALLRRIKRSLPPFEVQEGARLRRLRAL
jgi:hypothetical protein